VIFLERAYLPDDSATLGKLTVGDWACCTLENPWKANQPSVSCIPEGVYKLRLRDSPVVLRTTAGAFTRGWEVTDVRDRTLIMVHPGNWERNTEGCILPGRTFSWHPQNGPMVTHSQSTFKDLMDVLSAREEWDIHIYAKRADYP
jgi:hypothetical protein